MRKMKILEQPNPTAVSVPRVVRQEGGLVVFNMKNSIVFCENQLNNAMCDQKNVWVDPEEQKIDFTRRPK